MDYKSQQRRYPKAPSLEQDHERILPRQTKDSRGPQGNQKLDETENLLLLLLLVDVKIKRAMFY